MDRTFMFLKTQGFSAPAPRLYTCIRPKYSNIFFSETAWPIKAKLCVEHRKENEMKVNINGQSHMTKMAAMAINSKSLKKSSSSESEGLGF